MDRPKRPPPVPKFEDKSDKKQLQAKLNSFMSEINQSNAEAAAVTAKIEVKPQTVVKAGEGKKKAALASINSKLNNMLSAKKININTALTAETEKEKQEKQEREEKIKRIEVQYDPQCPNNYQISKQQFIKLFASQLEEQQQKEEVEGSSKAEQMEVEQEQECVAEEKEQVALRMMQKFGYKVGEGLGKQGQGIKTPLIVKKVNDTSGVIEQSNISLNYLIPPEVSARNALAAHGVEADSVVVLVGLLSMEDLQQGVEREIREECEKFGIIKDWIIYLWGNELRIFVVYQTKEQGFNAFLKMNGKFFGETLVSVRFYSRQAFERKVLDNPLHAHVPT